MSSENTRLWDLLGRTDPAHTKGFTRGGGFKGTAIKPMWSYRRMTEEFGPCGKGWGVDRPEFQVVPAGDEILVFCTVNVWWRDDTEEARPDGYIPMHHVHGVGGDKVVNKFSSGIKSDDEAFKKAFTDAVTNALKLIGVGADVHMGMFDDNKYVNTMRQEFADDHQSPTPNTVTGPALVAANQPAKSSAALKREGAWEQVMAELQSDFVDCHSIASLHKLRIIYRQKAIENGWNKAFLDTLKNEFDQQEDALKKASTMLAGE